jgi:uncharacterized protein YqjF (DUF2071 family)
MNEPKPPTADERAQWQQDPDQPVVLYQKWRDLLFAHWSFDPDVIQKSLPEGLRVDTFHHRAWVGVVPFFMKEVHPRFLPSVPMISDFLELNVRTYVLDKNGRPGVWFYSLDCSQRLAVQIARIGYYLPYFDAEMSATVDADGMIDYRCQRRRHPKATRFWYGGSGQPHFAQPGTLEFFLVERYLLFARDPASGDIHCGRVHHTPYPLLTPKLAAFDTVMFELAGLPVPAGDPEHIHFSRGVDVKTYTLHRCSELRLHPNR